MTLYAACYKGHGDNIVRARLMGEPREWLLKRRAYLSRSGARQRAMQRVMYFKSVPFEGGVKSRCKIWSNKARRELDLAGSFSAQRCGGPVVPCRKNFVEKKKKTFVHSMRLHKCVPLQTYRLVISLGGFLRSRI